MAIPMIAFDTHDTIVAIASPSGPAHRGIIRLSGAAACEIALAGFRGDSQDPLSRRPKRRTGHLSVDGLRNELPAELLLWPGPKTYTGQTLAEIHTLGAPALLGLVLAQCLKQGARMAEPGEFTLRAFLNGKLDLTRAEAVLGVIEARNPAQLDAALKQLAGGLFDPITTLRDQLLDTLAHLEANLDFNDEPDVDPLGRLELAESLSRGSRQLLTLADRLNTRERIDGLPRVVLVGPPNAGKSRLFNALLGRDQAIVSPIAGTTRDYLTGTCECDGFTFELVDTAGEESATHIVDQQAQVHRGEQSVRADLLLLCTPCDAREEPGENHDPGSMRVRTKSDLLPTREPRTTAHIDVSAQTGDGLHELKIAIVSAMREFDSREDVPTSTAARCRDSILRAGESLGRASEAIALELGDELVSADLRQAIDDLGRVVGDIVTDDILDRIFSRFCIGK